MTVEKMRRGAAWCIVVACALSLSACDESPGAPSDVYDKPTLDAKYRAVTDLVSTPTCSATVQCAATPLGAKPCGGPWRYLVYSRLNTNEQELRRRVDELYAFEREYNIRNGVASDCSIAQAANPACAEGVCVDLNARR